MQPQPEVVAPTTGSRRREVERLCRLCATITTHPNQRVDIFAVEGLRSKIETCLPVHVFKDSLLPDTLCASCNDKICAFFAFRKRSLETLKILEDNFHVTESCFFSPTRAASPKRAAKADKSTGTENLDGEATQFEAWKCKTLATFEYEAEDVAGKRAHRRAMLDCAQEIRKASAVLERLDAERSRTRLVAYAASSEDEQEEQEQVEEEEATDVATNTYRHKLYFDDKVNDIIHEIQERKSTKRKLEALFGDGRPAKLARLSTGPTLGELFASVGGSSRRKKRPPARRTTPHQETTTPPTTTTTPPQPHAEQFPQVCLLCDRQFAKGALLAKHVFDTHGIDMAQVLSSQPIPEGMTREPPPPPPASPKTASAEKKKKLPELVKIADLKAKRDSVETKATPDDAPPTLTASYVCPLCPASLTNRTDLYAHLRARHAHHAKLICGLCLHIGTSVGALQEHVEACARTHAVVGHFVCQVCRYAEDNQKSLENHILVHDFLLGDCKKDGKIFDPSDYMETNAQCEQRVYACAECGSTLQSFKEYSSHKRSEHSVFHCDLCNKSYGRNSHLWKHVNRVHKGHPSVTCQFCYKTSASKYHLLQHFNKIHTQKAGVVGLGAASSGAPAAAGAAAARAKNGEALSEFEEDDFMSRKFDPFDFQSVRQSFMRAELEAKRGGVGGGGGGEPEAAKKVAPRGAAEMRDLSALKMPSAPPKELDSSSTIYTNIITNYTPPTNDGEHKCPKCAKAFHKRTLLKKHKKNCRPRLQKDLLTRCKSCSRIFKDRQSLAKHLVNYHSEYSCEMCAEKVQSKCEIVSHIRFTHPSSHLVCADCGNVLRNADLLRAHRLDHANSFVCQFCGDVLPSKIKLKMHILSLHRKILSLSCGVCLKLFESQHVLRDHVRMVHREALQPLTSCTVCGKNYGSKWKTYDHLNKSHGRVFRACKVCLEVFNNEQELQAHVDAHHGKGAPKKCAPAENSRPPCEPKAEARSDLDDVDDDDDDHHHHHHDRQSDLDEDEYAGKSILEKHLVGAYGKGNNNLHHHQAAAASSPQQQQQQQGKQNGLVVVGAPATPKGGRHAHAHHADELINSSKRTVYVNSNDPSVCDICHKNWPAKKHLWQHYIRCHKQVAATVCGICLSTNQSYADLQRHLNAEHPTLLHGRGFGSNFICRICGRYHNASSKLKLHMAIHIKFDWSLLDDPAAFVKREQSQSQSDDDGGGETRKFKVKIKPPAMKQELRPHDDVNFESMIEQVECSTNSSSTSESEDDDGGGGEGEGEAEGDAEMDNDDEDVEGEEDDDDEGEEDDEDDEEEEDDDVEDDEEHNVSQAEEEIDEEQEEVEEMSDDEGDEEDDDEDDEDDDDDMEEVPEAVPELPEIAEIPPAANHDKYEALDDEDDDDGDDDEDENYERADDEYEEVVEEVVHQDDITIYEQGEIIDGSYIEGEQIVVQHIVQDDDGDVEQIVEEIADDDDDDDDGVIYEPAQVTYVQHDAEDVDSAVQSICYEDEDDSCHDGNVAEEYEVQSTNAPGMNNQHEIQSAVDSIL